MITQNQINEWVKDNKPIKFYKSYEWRLRRKDVLALDKWECQMCKARGKYSKAVVVHHVKHLKDRPDLAMQIYDGDQRQLISLCRSCHEECHPERLKYKQYRRKAKPHPIDERW